MIWRLILHRIIFQLIAIIILPLVTAYCTARKKDRLPDPLDNIFGCEEDGWNGNGCDPNNPRHYWVAGDWDAIHEDAAGDPTGTQGWWPNYKRWNWARMSFIKRWFASYQWLLRNVCWNLRLTDWFGISIHHKDIKPYYMQIDHNTGEMTIEWFGKDRKEYWHRRKRIGKYLIEYGWEFYPYVFDVDDPLFRRIRDHGYTREYKYKHRSVPSIRIRKA